MMTSYTQPAGTAATLRRRAALLTAAAALSLCNVGCEAFFPLRAPAPKNNAFEAQVTATGKVQGVDKVIEKNFRVCMPDDLNPDKNGGHNPVTIEGDTVADHLSYKYRSAYAVDGRVCEDVRAGC